MGGSGNDTVNFNSGLALNDYVSGQSGHVTIDVSADETQVGSPVTNPNGSTSLTFTEGGNTQTLTYSGAHVTVTIDLSGRDRKASLRPIETRRREFCLYAARGCGDVRLFGRLFSA